MCRLFSKIYYVFCLYLVLFVHHAYAQDSCYDCNIDSLTRSLKTVTNNSEKAGLLSLVVDLLLLRTSTNYPGDDPAITNLKSLIELSESQKVENIDAYKSLSQAFAFMGNKDYLNGQTYLKRSITLFDKNHKKIPNLLLVTRYAYNLAGNQEDRYVYYNDKLNYYLVNGPIENVASCYYCLGGYYSYRADYNLAISNYLKSVAIFKNYNQRSYRNGLSAIGNAYGNWGNFEKAFEFLNKAIPLDKIAGDSLQLIRSYNTLAFLNRNLKKYREVLSYADTALLYNNNHQPPEFMAMSYVEKALAFIEMNKLKEGLYHLDQAKKIADSFHTSLFFAGFSFELDYGYFQYCSKIEKYDEAVKYLLIAYKKSVDVRSNELQVKYLKELSLFYGQQHNSQLAFYYTKKFYDLTEALDKEHSVFKISQYENEEKEMRQKDSINLLKQDRAIQAATLKTNSRMLLGALLALVLISVALFFVYREYRINKKILSSLRKTQHQLIISEKMASLGELTAGIAHEIQNPLNFVNNFSEVDTELIDELEQEIGKGNLDDIKIITKDLKENEQKILHHGRRADAIVKGMLQHSRTSTGVKEPTDINNLADEYLRLSYHGMRAKDKEFNAEIKTKFGETIGKINVVPQDIGRVLLNLINNAFYAVNERCKAEGVRLKAESSTREVEHSSYVPTVTVVTKKISDKIAVKVIDNGNGIPQNIVDKIFQPFFTTKPTGQGTGLGLSLSYDIVKAHGGEIRVETKESVGTDFIIMLPA